jgi:hypothetical protein
MGIMVCGGETTREDRFIYGEEVARRIDRAMLDLESAQENALNVSQLKAKRRAILESLAWFAYLRNEEE